MIDAFTAAIIASIFIMIIVNLIFFYRNRKFGDQARTTIDINSLKTSTVTKAMIGSYIVMGLIFGGALFFTSFSNWLVMVIILGTAGLCIYGSLMRKKWALIPWGAMSLVAVGGLFLGIDRARMSFWGIIGLIIIAIILHYYNVEKASWN